ncbi:hypothetical protein TrST_g446 [Triparma strigata]|uniref:Uncharacterized protein n=2 Tax=Triparma TaxID=722752 RepID=A0A9W7EMQ6_9STRA|nr:hypothetical protein TrST_g446 [Triparma strigata]
MAKMMGLDGTGCSMAVVFVVVTGILGASVGRKIMDSWKVSDPVARGLGLGVAAHGLGTASLKDEKEAFPFAAIAMAGVGIFSTVLVGVGGKAIKAVLG